MQNSRMQIRQGGFTLVEVCVSMAVLAFGLSVFLTAFVMALKGANETSSNNTSTPAVRTLFARLNAAYNTGDGAGSMRTPNFATSGNKISWIDDSDKNARFTSAGDPDYTIINGYPILVTIKSEPNGPITNTTTSAPIVSRKLYQITAALYSNAYRQELFEQTKSFSKVREAQATSGVFRTYLYGVSQ